MKEEIILAIIGSGALFTFIQFLITRNDNKKNKQIDKLVTRLDGISASQYRTEMLVMMNHYPEQTSEIMKLAEYYFVNGGDFYMTSLFAKFLKEHSIEKPKWFNDND